MVGMSARMAGVLVAVGALFAGPAPAAPAASPLVRVGTAPALPRSATVTGSLPGASELKLTVALASQDPGGLQRLAGQVSDPRSPLFRHYLSVSEFARRFGAIPAHVAAVRSALQARGLTVGTPTANDLTLPVSGTAAQVEQAFSTSLSRVKLAGGRTAYADAVAPALSPGIAGDVQAVVGLDNLNVPRPAQLSSAAVSRGVASAAAASPSATAPGSSSPPEPSPCGQATTVARNSGGYTADTVAAAYQFSSLFGLGDAGAGQTIGLYELQPLDPADVSAYQTCYQTSASVSYVGVDSPPAHGPGSDDTEAAIDAEQVIGLAPQAHVIVYQAPDTGAGGLDLYSEIVSANVAKVISVSWVDCEADAAQGGSGVLQAEDQLFAEATVQGQSMLVASGDNGSAACSTNSLGNELSVDDPASQPYATAVGGTALYSTTAAGGSPIPWAPGATLDEGVWNGGADPQTIVPSASGGGLSSVWSMPGYQSTAAGSVGVINANSSGSPCGNTYCRQVPDVSADGDPATGYVMYVNGSNGGGWATFAGTSAAAPLWAALTALANALPACRGLPIGFENPALYELAGTPVHASYFRDITLADPFTHLANNDALGANAGIYPVTAGYDLATGLGAPIAPALAAGLCQLRAPVFRVTFAGIATQTAFLHVNVRLSVPGADSGRVALSYSASGLPRGLSINSQTGLISGRPAATGTYAVVVSAHDFAANSGQTRFELKVLEPPPRFSGVRLTGLAQAAPRLVFTVGKVGGAPALRSATVRLPRGLRFTGLGRGVRVQSGRTRVKFKLGLRRGLLTISFARTQGEVTATIAGPAIAVSRSLASAARRHRAGKVVVRLGATDSAMHIASFTIRLPLAS